MSKLECLFHKHKFEIPITCYNLYRSRKPKQQDPLLLCLNCKKYARCVNDIHIVYLIKEIKNRYKALEWWNNNGSGGGIYKGRIWIYKM